jgi:hypothetical protein
MTIISDETRHEIAVIIAADTGARWQDRRKMTQRHLRMLADKIARIIEDAPQDDQLAQLRTENDHLRRLIERTALALTFALEEIGR